MFHNEVDDRMSIWDIPVADIARMKEEFATQWDIPEDELNVVRVFWLSNPEHLAPMYLSDSKLLVVPKGQLMIEFKANIISCFNPLPSSNDPTRPTNIEVSWPDLTIIRSKYTLGYPDGQNLFVNHVKREHWKQQYFPSLTPEDSKLCNYCFSPECNLECSGCVVSVGNASNDPVCPVRYCSQECVASAWYQHNYICSKQGHRVDATNTDTTNIIPEATTENDSSGD